MSDVFIYGILCEDKAHRNFIEHYFSICHKDIFLEQEEFRWRIHASNAKEVDDSVADATRLGFTRFGLDVLVVGRDADSTEPKRIEILKTALRDSCQHHHPKVVFMVPVQCIEHWLLYIKKHIENPVLTKNEPLESIRRPDCKKLVYGDVKKPDNQVIIASELMTHFNVDWLESRSESFKQFHQQVIHFIQQNQQEP
nr:hypothetical protein [uncultured Arsenicibacter sp.]